ADAAGCREPGSPLRRVLGVDAHVVVGEVAGPDARGGAAGTEIDADLDLASAPQARRGPRDGRGTPRGTVATHRHPRELDPRARTRRSRTRAAPTVWRMRPQFGSAPKTAVFTRSEFAIRRAARSASAVRAAPETETVTSFVAPSPSRARARASDSATSPSAVSKRPAPPLAGPRSAAWPASPLASSTTQSEVDVSPSTVTRLKVASAASRSARRRKAGATAASVKRKASIVAMSGSIMPEPLAMPPTVSPRAPTRARAAATFATRSVV